VVICLEQGADLHMPQLIPLPLTVSCFSKIQIGLPFWYQLTWIVPVKGPLNGCVWCTGKIYLSDTIYTYIDECMCKDVTTPIHILALYM